MYACKEKILNMLNTYVLRYIYMYSYVEQDMLRYVYIPYINVVHVLTFKIYRAFLDTPEAIGMGLRF